MSRNRTRKPRIHHPDKGWGRVDSVSPRTGQVFLVGKGWKGWFVPGSEWATEGVVQIAQMFREAEVRIARVQRGIDRLRAEGRAGEWMRP